MQNRTTPPPQLSVRQRNIVRTATRNEYLCRRGDLDEMIQRAGDRVQRLFGRVVIDDALTFSAELIHYWYGSGIDEPSAVAVAGEPRVGVEA